MTLLLSSIVCMSIVVQSRRVVYWMRGDVDDDCGMMIEDDGRWAMRP